MASRFGPRAGGTDGSDYAHRETVAAHYKESVLFKSRLLRVIYGHFALVAAASVYLALVTHRPWWLLAWMCTALTGVVGVLAVPKNHASLVTIFALNNLVLGMGSSLFGLYAFAATKSGSLLLAIGCLCAIALHILELVFSRSLIGIWTSKRSKRT